MAPRANGPSPAEHAAGDDARDLYDELTDDLLYDPAIGRATIMGHPCVRLAGRFVTSYDTKAGGLILKLPGERVAGLIESGTGVPFSPAGKVLREWVCIPEPDRDLWRALLAEATDFARKGLAADSGPGQGRSRPQ